MKRVISSNLALAIAGAWALAFTGCAPSGSPRAGGARVVAERSPRKIVSLAPSTTEVLYALGLSERIAGVTSQCDYPAGVKDKPKIGDATTNLERVVDLDPDLVVAHSFVNREAVRGLKTMGLRIVSVDPKTLDEVAESFVTVARACGAAEEGERLATEMREGIADLTREGERPRPKVLFAAQASPLWAAGPGTFVGEMIEKTGGQNVHTSKGASFTMFSPEAALAARPDVILVSDDVSLRFFQDAESWRSVPAVRNNRVIKVDGDLYLRPTPRLLDGMRELADIVASTQTDGG